MMQLDPITMHRLTQDIFEARLKGFEDVRQAVRAGSEEPRFRLNLVTPVRSLLTSLQRHSTSKQPALARVTSTQEIPCVSC